jgi:tripeptide aminopeptidase
MDSILDRLPEFENALRAMMETVIANILFIGQVPAPTFHEKDRSQVFLNRLAEFQVECTTDGYHNPIGIIRGQSGTRAPIFVVAHMDTSFGRDIDHNFSVSEDYITGTGIMDNSVGVGVMLSLPEIFRRLELGFESDIVLAGVIQSIGRGNLRGIRHLLKTWSAPIRAAVCIEGGELGRLNYYCDGMIRAEIECKILHSASRTRLFRPNAILVINQVINQILELRLPQKPRCEIVIGTISGGLKHGRNPYEAKLGFEIRSDSDEMVRSLYAAIKDMVDGIRHEFDIELTLKTVSNVSASRLKFNHPLVKSAIRVMHRLGLEPFSEPSESELSIFLARQIPAVTLGVTCGESYPGRESSAQIAPLFKGIAQIIGVILAIDRGVCDEPELD